MPGCPGRGKAVVRWRWQQLVRRATHPERATGEGGACLPAPQSQHPSSHRTSHPHNPAPSPARGSTQPASHQPVVRGPARLKLQRAQRVGDVLERVHDAVRVVVRGVDAPACVWHQRRQRHARARAHKAQHARAHTRACVGLQALPAWPTCVRRPPPSPPCGWGCSRGWCAGCRRPRHGTAVPSRHMPLRCGMQGTPHPPTTCPRRGGGA